ncbi:Copper chaperone CopZ [Arthrobacter alpinus]|uniref:Copper chaperone CopZ n=1 Tax=Arthrobacter alpinus TaxID=656366 RepID=A0A1H5PE80_9MICC|nr:heavy-metal-associated domain-containing protein [Arthrobacter alpinus]SEF11341.1 Copper chaperone CopZ [Arthrobacter alpinus]
MCGTETPKDLKLTQTTESSCSCCSTETTEAKATGESGTAYSLEGLTCGHCVQSVEIAVAAIEGVESATVDLVAGGISTLMVSGPVLPEDIRSAVATAGYTVTKS